MDKENGNGKGHGIPAENGTSPLWESKVEILEQVDLNTQRVRIGDQEVFRVTPLLERKKLERQQAPVSESSGLPSLAWDGSA